MSLSHPSYPYCHGHCCCPPPPSCSAPCATAACARTAHPPPPAPSLRSARSGGFRPLALCRAAPVVHLPLLPLLSLLLSRPSFPRRLSPCACLPSHARALCLLLTAHRCAPGPSALASCCVRKCAFLLLPSFTFHSFHAPLSRAARCACCPPTLSRVLLLLSFLSLPVPRGCSLVRCAGSLCALHLSCSVTCPTFFLCRCLTSPNQCVAPTPLTPSCVVASPSPHAVAHWSYQLLTMWIHPALGLTLSRTCTIIAFVRVARGAFRHAHRRHCRFFY